MENNFIPLLLNHLKINHLILINKLILLIILLVLKINYSFNLILIFIPNYKVFMSKLNNIMIINANQLMLKYFNYNLLS